MISSTYRPVSHCDCLARTARVGGCNEALTRPARTVAAQWGPATSRGSDRAPCRPSERSPREPRRPGAGRPAGAGRARRARRRGARRPGADGHGDGRRCSSPTATARSRRTRRSTATPATRWASGNGPDEDVPFTAWLQVDLGADGVRRPRRRSRGRPRSRRATTSRWRRRRPTTRPRGRPCTPRRPATAAPTTSRSRATDARYVRIQMNQRTSFDWDPARLHWYGYSLFSLEVYGTATQVAVAFATVRHDGPRGRRRDGPGDPGDRRGHRHDRPRALDRRHRRGRHGLHRGRRDGDLPGRHDGGDASPSRPSTTARSARCARSSCTLSEPSDGLVLGGRTTSTVTITPHGDLPDVGARHGARRLRVRRPRRLHHVGHQRAGHPGAVARARWTGAATASSRRSAGTPAPGDWFGFTHDIAATDWSAHDGFTFWFLGTGGGGLLRYELKSNGQLFERSVIDDTAGWRQVNVAFSQLRLKGNPASDARFDPSASTGLRGHADRPGRGRVDVRRPRPVRPGRPRSRTPRVTSRSPRRAARSASSRGARSRTWCASASREQEREGVPAGNHVLSGDYQIPSGGWGGYSQNLAAGQDWSSFRGIRLAWYASQPTRPASPTAGDDIKVELKDGGPDGEHSELWAATFKDNWSSDGSRWKIVDLPFSQFTLERLPARRRGDAQRHPRPDVRVGLRADDRAGHRDAGRAGPSTTCSCTARRSRLRRRRSSAAPDVVLVDPGETAHVPVILTTTDGQPLPRGRDRRVRERRRHRGGGHPLRRVLRHAHVPRGHGLGRDADDRRGHARDGRGRRRPHARRST